MPRLGQTHGSHWLSSINLARLAGSENNSSQGRGIRPNSQLQSKARQGATRMVQPCHFTNRETEPGEEVSILPGDKWSQSGSPQVTTVAIPCAPRKDSPKPYCLHLFIHPFIHQVFTEHLLCTRLYARPWGWMQAVNKTKSLPAESLDSNVERDTTHERNQLCTGVESDTCCVGHQWVGS